MKILWWGRIGNAYPLNLQWVQGKLKKFKRSDPK